MQETTCAICKQSFPMSALLPVAIIRPTVLREIHSDFPSLPMDGFICNSDVSQYRMHYVENLLLREKGELSSLEEKVIASIRDHDLMSNDHHEEYEEHLSLGQRLADRMAVFGGSWTFLITFFCFLLIWIGVNSFVLLTQPFDPYPFILLNLILSCLAAIQAPVIMMSQNRQEAKDRLRAQQDYRINLKAELEIRHLHEKMDHLLLQQWQRLVEVQQVQIDLLEELKRR